MGGFWLSTMAGDAMGGWFFAFQAFHFSQSGVAPFPKI
jgi:hypothetical protein